MLTHEYRMRAIVIGGRSGIGEATQRLLRKRGAAVEIADKEPRPRGARGLAATYTVCDVTSPADVKELAAKNEHYLPNTVILTAGCQIAKPYDQLDEKDLNYLFRVNGFGPVLVAQNFAPILAAAAKKDRKAASLTIVASIAGLGEGGPGLEAYGMTKAAAISWSRAMARELAPHVRVNCVCPGWTDTDFNAPVVSLMGGKRAQQEIVKQTVPLARQAKPDEIAEAIGWIASDKASYVTGHVLVVDGGLTL